MTPMNTIHLQCVTFIVKTLTAPAVRTLRLYHPYIHCDIPTHLDIDGRSRSRDTLARCHPYSWSQLSLNLLPKKIVIFID